MSKRPYNMLWFFRRVIFDNPYTMNRELWQKDEIIFSVSSTLLVYEHDETYYQGLPPLLLEAGDWDPEQMIFQFYKYPSLYSHNDINTFGYTLKDYGMHFCSHPLTYRVPIKSIPDITLVNEYDKSGDIPVFRTYEVCVFCGANNNGPVWSQGNPDSCFTTKYHSAEQITFSLKQLIAENARR